MSLNIKIDDIKIRNSGARPIPKITMINNFSQVEATDIGKIVNSNTNTKKRYLCNNFSFMEELEEYLIYDKKLSYKQKNILIKNFISTGRNIETRLNKYTLFKYIFSSLILVGSTMTTALLSIDVDKFFWVVWVLSCLVTISKGTMSLFSVEKNYIDSNTKLIILKQQVWNYILTQNYDEDIFVEFCATLNSRLDDIVGNG